MSVFFGSPDVRVVSDTTRDEQALARVVNAMLTDVWFALHVTRCQLWWAACQEGGRDSQGGTRGQVCVRVPSITSRLR